MLRIFSLRGIFSLRPGMNPRSWVPEVSMLTTRPPKPLTSKLLEIQIEWVVYHITCGYMAFVSGGRDSVHIHSAGKHNTQNHDTPAHRSRNHTLYDMPLIRFVFQVTQKDLRSFLCDGRLLPKHVRASK
jgi:hypothetical protein